MNPMILMGLVSMALFIGMPKLVENSTSFLFPLFFPSVLLPFVNEVEAC